MTPVLQKRRATCQARHTQQVKPAPIIWCAHGIEHTDYLYWLAIVDDHARAIYKVLTKGAVGETYNIGGHNEKRNIEVVQEICVLLQEFVPNTTDYADLITYVNDRPGHDKRYAIDATKMKQELMWVPDETFESGLRKTVEWYVSHPSWMNNTPQPLVNHKSILVGDFA